MKATELRVNNLIDYKGCYTQIKDGGDIDHFEGLADANPILLTPEILEQCGFVKTKIILGKDMDFDYTDYRFGTMVINSNEKWEHVEVEYGPFDIEERGHICKLKHLHQLQNLFFALTGEELKVNLKQLV